jgi:hypothetical protein
MKRLATVCLVALVAAALTPQALDAGIGFRLGYSSATLSQASATPLPFNFGPLSSVTGGLSFEAGLGFISIDPELLYVRMGGRYDVDASNSLEFRHDYIQVPVLVKLNIIPVGPIRPFLCAGAYGAYLVNAKGVFVLDGVPSEEDMAGNYERFDYGLVGGAGLAFKLPGISLSIEGRFNYGLQNLLKDPAPGDSMKNECWMALAGISF